jgi:hypothetical protein
VDNTPTLGRVCCMPDRLESLVMTLTSLLQITNSSMEIGRIVSLAKNLLTPSYRKFVLLSGKLIQRKLNARHNSYLSGHIG